MRLAHVLSFSGGKDSTALYLEAVERGRPFLPVFADTGNEHEAVYEAVATLPGRVGGPEIVTVKADFTAAMAGRRAFIAARWPAMGVPQAIVDAAVAALHPTGSPFLDLAMWKGRFPGSQSRFCTEELKLAPIWRQVVRPLVLARRPVVSWQGVRAEESLARSTLPRWQRVNPAPHKAPAADRRLGETARFYAYRPLIDWTVDDVWAAHARHGVPRNRLYDMGASRVGCFPCIFVKKDDLRLIASRFPEAIDRIEAWEDIVSQVSKRSAATGGDDATFFSAIDDPLYRDGEPITAERFGIRAKVEWAKTSRGGRQYDLVALADTLTSCNEWGTCE